jgi:hypothetical protein
MRERERGREREREEREEWERKLVFLPLGTYSVWPLLILWDQREMSHPTIIDLS